MTGPARLARIAVLLLVPAAGLPAQAAAPPNAAARASIAGNRVRLSYEGRDVFDGTITGTDSLTVFQSLVDSATGAVTQVLKWTSFTPSRLALAGRVLGSAESFPAESDRREDGLAIVRHSQGLSHSGLNRAVYDRARDWVLSMDFPSRARVTPADSGAGGIAFAFEQGGQEVSLRFRPRFYQKHRGLAQFEPWTFQVRRDVPIGWTSWFAFLDRVTEADIRATADMMARRLAPWGYRVLQLDDGYQQLPIGVPDHWLRPNAKFPSGMEALARYIRERGLEPAIWTNVAFADAPWARAHPEYFLRDSSGTPVRGNWIGYTMDGGNPSTFPDLMAPVYRGFRDMGYTYFKLDALRHLRYEGYNSNASTFAARGLDREAVFRRVVEQVRATIGDGNFLLACWGARPELIGLVDAVRIGDDGFGYGGLAQYNSFNNVVWRNDPDHIELSKPDAHAAITATSLTGSHLMLTDKPAFYETRRSELSRLAAPVPFTLPGQLFDLDPTRSMRLTGVGSELSGAGPRPFDADQAPVTHLYLLDVNRPFERWTVLGRTGGESRPIPFTELGLADSTDYVVFEAWTRRFMGVQRGSLSLGAIDAAIGAQSLCLRQRLERPQVVATSRHLTCGGPDLLEVSWVDSSLTATSIGVEGEPYDLTVLEPAGFVSAGVHVDGGRVVSNTTLGRIRTIRILPDSSRRMAWRIRYRGAARSTTRRNPTERPM